MASPYSPSASGAPAEPARRPVAPPFGLSTINTLVQERDELRREVAEQAQKIRQLEAKDILGQALLGAVAKMQDRNKADVGSIYEAQGHFASREIIKVQEELLMRLSVPAIEDFLNNYFQKSITDDIPSEHLPERTAGSIKTGANLQHAALEEPQLTASHNLHEDVSQYPVGSRTAQTSEKSVLFNFWRGLDRAVYGHPQPDYTIANQHFEKLMEGLRKGNEADMEAAEKHWQDALMALHSA
ncbi:hypothetical protein KC343_g307 [Hortaea werneckii]|nr:hypothetical protein KC352_g6543 [Hortaea werneckii]KAI7572946.1 hypothetical protein KC317_g317 [Hortaea werneckii]KAI7628302.1 hypothetical protein KC346_g258 [Hortaea werneckii]KAI7638095.1 hypothetical protein KC343_g307 [Hortaea werneckii]KAI7683886.1 hypothetical protein KC319_g216 [Hortaea werneckii]